MVMIYRMQDKKGRGPFAPNITKKWLKEIRDTNEFLPSFIQFPGIMTTSRAGHVGCGCNSVEQLKRWFSQDEYAKLRKLGYQSVRMEVDEILDESNVQCIFRRTKPLRRDAYEFLLY